jgi:hypothetical protein
MAPRAVAALTRERLSATAAQAVSNHILAHASDQASLHRMLTEGATASS